MAQLRNLHRIATMTDGKSVTVGNNRVINRRGDAYIGRLHGKPIFKRHANGTITLDPCHYRTTTTRAAMNDFCSIFDVSCSVSFAGGYFKVRANGHDFTETDEGIIRFNVS